MNENRIDAKLTNENRQQILTAIATIKDNLPFLTSLTDRDRSGMLRLGDKSRAFVSLALDLASQNDSFLPRSFDVEEMRRDYELFEELQTIRLQLMPVMEQLEHTSTLAGSEAFESARIVYNYAKENAGNEGLHAIVEEMGRRFSRGSRSNSATPETATAEA